MKRYVIPIQMNDGENVKIQIQTKDHLKHKRKVKTWGAEEDERLVNLHNQHPKRWNVIAELMGNRNQNQCLHRFRRISQLGTYKKIWGEREDQLVLKMVAQFGFNWKHIASKLGTKSGKQIRERFINKLDPNIKRQQWAETEDLKLIELYSKYGSKWCQISRQLPGRPQNRIKNRFYSYIQKNYSFKIQKKESQNQIQNKQNQQPTFKGLEKKISQKKFVTEHNQLFGQNLILNCHQPINFQEQDIFDEQQQCADEQEQYSNKLQIQAEYPVKVEQVYFQSSMKQINDINDMNYTHNPNNDFLYFEDS